MSEPSHFREDFFMPYKDKKKQRAAEKRSKERAREHETEAPEREVEELDEMPVSLENIQAIAEMQDEDAKARAEAQADAKLQQYKKARVWAAVLYPDSMPPNWNEVIMQTGLSCALSPLHDADIKPDGSPKKAHFHFMMCWTGPTTYATAKRISKLMLGGTLPIPLVSPRGYYRYFTHLDNPDKAQYDAKQITHFNGFDPGDFIDLTKSEVLALKKELVKLILELGMLNYSEFVEYLLFNGTNEQFDIASSHTMFFKGYLDDRWKVDKARREAEVRNGRQRPALSSDSTLGGEAVRAALDSADGST